MSLTTADCACGDGTCTPGHGEDVNTCNADCECNDGICSTGETNANCAADCFCGNGRCDLDETTTSCPSDCPNYIGAPCAAGAARCDVLDGQTGVHDAFCARNMVAGTFDWPEGYCTADVENTFTCPTGSTAVQLGATFGPTYCMKNCVTSADCRQSEGYICTTHAGPTSYQPVCTPAL